MFKFVDILWGVAVPFDVEKKNLYMVYYGVYIKTVFIGVGRIVDKDELNDRSMRLKLS